MGTMTTFEQWYTDLAQDQIWFEQATMNHRTETVMAIARQIWVNGLAEGESFKLIPMKAHRQHLFNKLSKLPPDRVKKKWWVKESDKEDVKPEAPPLTGEERDKWLRLWEETLKNAPPVRTTPKLTSQMIEEEGGVRPKAVQPYPTTSLTEFEKHQRHLEWIKYAYDPRTGDRIPGTLDENEFAELNK